MGDKRKTETKEIPSMLERGVSALAREKQLLQPAHSPRCHIGENRQSQDCCVG
jgi:hypothetical protein